MGITLSTISWRAAITPDSRRKPHDSFSQYEEDTRPPSRGSSFGPTSSLIYESIDEGSTRLRESIIEGRQEPEPTTSQDPHLGPICPWVITTPHQMHPMSQAVVTPANSLQELRESPLDTYLPPHVLGGDALGNFIVRFPPQRLHAYPRIARAIPTAQATPSGLFDLPHLVSCFEDDCQRFEVTLDDLSYEVKHLRLQILATERLLEELTEISEGWDGNVLEAAELNRSFLIATSEKTDLSTMLSIIRKTTQTSVVEALTGGYE